MIRRERAVVGAAAVVAAAVVAAIAAGAPAANAAAAAGVGLAAAGVIGGWPGLGGASAVILGGAFVLDLPNRIASPMGVALVAVALFVSAELVAWAAESRTARPPGTPVVDRVRRLAANAVVGLAGALVVMAAGSLPPMGDLAFAAVGAAALVASALVIVALARGRSAG